MKRKTNCILCLLLSIFLLSSNACKQTYPVVSFKELTQITTVSPNIKIDIRVNAPFYQFFSSDLETHKEKVSKITNMLNELDFYKMEVYNSNGEKTAEYTKIFEKYNPYSLNSSSLFCYIYIYNQKSNLSIQRMLTYFQVDFDGTVYLPAITLTEGNKYWYKSRTPLDIVEFVAIVDVHWLTTPQ